MVCEWLKHLSQVREYTRQGGTLIAMAPSPGLFRLWCWVVSLLTELSTFGVCNWEVVAGEPDWLPASLNRKGRQAFTAILNAQAFGSCNLESASGLDGPCWQTHLEAQARTFVQEAAARLAALVWLAIPGPARGRSKQSWTCSGHPGGRRAGVWRP